MTMTRAACRTVRRGKPHRTRPSIPARPRLARLHQVRRAEREHGAVSVQLMIAVPLLNLLLMLGVQFALYAHAAHVAQAAAAQALAAARAETGTPTAGDAQARAVLGQLASGLLRDPSVSVSRDATQVHVEVTGVPPAVVPFLQLPVHAVAHGPAEAWTTGR
jgi:Flp pilus assembly protein TadG